MNPRVEKEVERAKGWKLELEEGRREFETERLTIAKERKALGAEKVSMSRTAEATRLLQLQLVAGVSSSPTPQRSHTDREGEATAAASAVFFSTAASTAAPPAEPPTSGQTDGAASTGGSPETTWRKWIKPQPRPQPIPPAVPTAVPTAPTATAGGDAATRSPAKMPILPSSVAASLSPAARVGGEADEGGALSEQLARWRADLDKAADTLSKQKTMLHTLAELPAAPLRDTSNADRARDADRARMPPPPPMRSAAVGAQWSSPARAAYSGRPSFGGASRLSYQFGPIASMATPSALGDSTSSTPYRHSVGHPAGSSWYRAPAAVGALPAGQQQASMHSSSMVSLHSVRLSSWGSLPSRSSGSPAAAEKSAGGTPPDAAGADEPANDGAPAEPKPAEPEAAAS